MSNQHPNTDITPGTIMMATKNNGLTYVGVATGDRDDCGTEDETEALSSVVVHDEYGRLLAERHPRYAFLLTSLEPADGFNLVRYLEHLEDDRDAAERVAQAAEQAAEYIRGQVAAAQAQLNALTD